MSTVIRKVIIETELRSKKGRLDAPDVGPAERAYKAEAQAVLKVEESTKRASISIREHSDAVQAMSFKSVAAFREAGEGVLRMTRGLALLSASGSDDLRRLMRTVALAQGAFDVFAGSFKMLQNLSLLVGGPATAAIGGITAAIGIGVTAWGRWKQSAEEARKVAAEAHEAAMQAAKEFAAGWEAQRRAEAEARQRAAGVSGLRRRAAELAAGGVTPDILAQQRAGLDAEMAAIERDARVRLRGFQARTFGGSAEDAFAALLQFGSQAQLGNALDLEQRRRSIMERQLEVHREDYDLRRKQAEEQKRITDQFIAAGAQNAAGTPIFGGLAAQAAANLGVAFNQQTEQAMRRVAQTTKDAMDQVISTMETVDRRLERIEQSLSGFK